MRQSLASSCSSLASEERRGDKTDVPFFSIDALERLEAAADARLKFHGLAEALNCNSKLGRVLRCLTFDMSGRNRLAARSGK